MGNKVEGQQPNGNDNQQNVNVENHDWDQIKNQRQAYLEKMGQLAQEEELKNKVNSNSNKMEIDDNSENDKKIDNIPINNLSNKIIQNTNNIIPVIKPQVQEITKPKVQEPVKPKKEIDLEHVTIEKMFKITLDPLKSDKLRFMEEYLQGLTDAKKELKFRVSDLDNLIVNLIELEKNNIVDYFLKCFHRGYELIEIRYKALLAEKFYDTNRLIISYLSMVLTYPENFDIDINYNDTENIFLKFIEDTKETNQDELLHFFTLCFTANEENDETLKCIFNYIINIFNRQNIKCFIDQKGNVSLLFFLFFI